MFISQGHGVKHSTAQDGWAQRGDLSSSAPNTDKVQTPSALSALLPGAYRLGTYTYEKRKQTQKSLLKHKTGAHTHIYILYKNIIDVQARKTLTQEGIKESLTTKSLNLLLTKAQEAAGDRYTENQ